MNVALLDTQTTTETGNRGLPSWAYHNAELSELERELVFRRNWLFAGHVNQIPNPGDYMCLNEVDERAIIIRGEDGQIRAFHNLCRHRGSRVVADDHGHTGKTIVCPFHGWCYSLDGALRGVPMRETFPDLDQSASGLKPVDFEIWHGLVFVRFKGDGPSVSEQLAAIDGEVSHYGIEDMIPDGSPWQADFEIDWKSVMDVDNEGYHVPVAHPSLNALFHDYGDRDLGYGVNRSHGLLRENDERLWSVRHYLKLLPGVTAPHLPESQRKTWVYFGMFPNFVLTLYPDGLADFYHTFPGEGMSCAMRGSSFRHVDDSREARAVRYLKDRIDRETTKEDVQLIKWSWEGMRSSAFDGVMLSEAESGVQAYHDHLRRLMPVLNLANAPESGTVAQVNAELGGPAL